MAAVSHAQESRPLAWIRLLRPKQWVKNSLLYLPFFFTLNLYWDFAHPGAAFSLLGQVTLGFTLYCFLASGTYIINDILDVDHDRAHPEKRRRPLAAGLVPTRAANVLAAGLLTIGLSWAFLMSVPMGTLAVGYVLLTVGYSIALKNLAIVDIFAVAGGYVMRVLAGAVVIDVPVSPWLYLCTILGALLISLVKRRAEARLMQGDAATHRSTLAVYTPKMMDRMIAVVAPSTLLAYVLYTFTASNLPVQMMLTIPLVVYGLFRYLQLTRSGGLGGAPEEVLLTDRPLLLAVVLWLATVVGVLLIFPRP